MIKKIPYPDRDAWLEVRKKAIGGSDAAAVAGFSKWASPLSVYADKLGLVPEREDNEAMRQGRDLEEYVAQRFCEDSKLSVRRENHILVNDAYPFMHANIDRRIVGAKEGLECKTTSVYNKTDFAGGDVPPEYYIQVQHYLAVTGWPVWHLAVLVLNRGFYRFRVERNEADIAALIEMEEDFWTRHIIAQRPPEPNCNDGDLIRDLYPAAEDSFVPLYHLEGQINELIEVKSLIAGYEERKQALENVIKLELGTATTGSCGEFEVTWKERASSRFDTSAFKKDHPDVYKSYLKESKTRTFLVKESKEDKEKIA